MIKAVAYLVCVKELKQTWYSNSIYEAVNNENINNLFLAVLASDFTYVGVSSDT